MSIEIPDFIQAFAIIADFGNPQPEFVRNVGFKRARFPLPGEFTNPAGLYIVETEVPLAPGTAGGMVQASSPNTSQNVPFPAPLPYTIFDTMCTVTGFQDPADGLLKFGVRTVAVDFSVVPPTFTPTYLPFQVIVTRVPVGVGANPLLPFPLEI